MSNKSANPNQKFQNTNDNSEIPYAKQNWICFITDISLRPLQLFSQLTTVLNEDEELSALKVISSKKLSRPSSHTVSGFKENEQSI